MNRLIKPFVFVLAAVYFAADELFTGIAKPISNWLSQLRMLEHVRKLDQPPKTLSGACAVPGAVILLEPIKPVATYLLATGEFVYGALVFAVGETLKR